ncbi:hypothetical protein MC885_021179 [Smutsia gigantea]|nr:hypothetical protein MC885_021179 [Smutsia gigantea]
MELRSVHQASGAQILRFLSLARQTIKGLRAQFYSGPIRSCAFGRERQRGGKEVSRENDKFRKEEISTSEDILNNEFGPVFQKHFVVGLHCLLKHVVAELFPHKSWAGYQDAFYDIKIYVALDGLDHLFIESF